MAANSKTLEYLTAGVNALIEHGSFRNGEPFRPTQHDALHAYREFLQSDELSPEEKLKGFFELATGIGKTALFLSILDEAHRVAAENDDKLRTMIVVPTITLLDQMQDDVKKWAPNLSESLGFYGGKYRQLGKDLTVIIYNSWDKLMEEGKIDSSKVDILISDEAHRGTSERRLSNKFNSFSNGTVEIAFTATSRFDDEKSVEQSHARKIFGRDIAESVRLDELAAYIQTQLHVIRIEPRDLHEEFEDASENIAGMRLGMRQDAWMRQMAEVYKSGRDEHTGDLLSDNKAGFYVSDIAMADRMEEMLNADPVLRQRAKDFGMKGVAVSIHSKMPQNEQRELLKAFKRGEYMACISDSKLKEGFDDPSLKTIFDFPRGSLVDKAQIVGRGARKWFNPDKQRFEGATIIDTIVYIGSNDPIEDKRLKESALSNAVMAWSVLDGTEVISSARLKSNRPRLSSGGGSGVSAVHGLTVDSHVSMEALNAIYAEQQKLKEEDRVEITEDIRNELKEHMARTKVGATKFMILRKDVPASLNIGKLHSYAYNENVKNCNKYELEYILEVYRSLPNSNTISFTDEMRGELKDHIKRTGLGARRILLQNNFPDTINADKIENWASNYIVKSVDAQEWDLVLSTYKKTPSSRMQELTDAMRQELSDQMERTGIGAKKIIGTMKRIPKGLTEYKIRNWCKDQSTKSVNRLEWNAVIRAYSAQPDTKLKDFMPFTEDMRVELVAQMERTGIGAAEIFKRSAEVSEISKVSRLNTLKRANSGVKIIAVYEWNTLMKAYREQQDKVVTQLPDIAVPSIDP